MPTRRYFANNAPSLTLNASLTSGATTCTISGTFAGYPSQFPFFAELDYGTASAEIVSVTGIAGTTATIVRGQGGTAAISHAAGATFDFVVVAQDLDEANAHTSANAGVHGVSGSVVGTSDVQTLTNKTLSAPTVTGTMAAASATFSGGVTTTGTETAGNFVASGNGAHTGVLVPKSYANEATATTAIGAPVTGSVVWLTAPTAAGTAAGLFEFNGTAWKPLAVQDINVRSYANESAASTALGSPVTGQLVWLTAPTTTSTSAGLFAWNGSAWKSLVQWYSGDTGWINCTVNAGFTALAGNVPQARLKNGEVKLRGGVTNGGMAINTAYASVITLPASIPNPPTTQLFTMASSAGNVTAHSVANASGNLDVRTGAVLGAYYQFNDVHYWTD